MRVTFWNSFEECEELVRTLDAERGDNPFLGIDWLKTHWQHFGSRRGRHLLLTGVWQGDELVCFAPLCVRRRSTGLRQIEFVGEGLSDYMGFIGEASPRTVEAVAAAVSRKWPDALFRLHDIGDETELRGVLDNANVFQRVARVTLYPCSYRDMDAVREMRLSASMKKHRQRIRSGIRRLEMIGELRTVALDFDTDREKCLRMLPELFDLHRLRHEGTLNAWCQERNRAFLDEYLRGAERTNMLLFAVLLDDVPVVFQLGMRSRARFFGYIQAFHPAFAAYGLGHVGLHLKIEQCAEAGIRVVDFSKGASVSKHHWATGDSQNYRYYGVCRTSARNWLAMNGELLVLRAKVWGREKGFNTYLRAHLGKVRRAVDSLWRREAASDKGTSVRAEQWRRFRYSDVSDLPMRCLSRTLDFVHRNSAKAPVECRRLPGELVLRAQDSHEEARVAIPHQHGALPGFSALTRGVK